MRKVSAFPHLRWVDTFFNLKTVFIRTLSVLCQLPFASFAKLLAGPAPGDSDAPGQVLGGEPGNVAMHN